MGNFDNTSSSITNKNYLFHQKRSIRTKLKATRSNITKLIQSYRDSVKFIAFNKIAREFFLLIFLILLTITTSIIYFSFDVYPSSMSLQKVDVI